MFPGTSNEPHRTTVQMRFGDTDALGHVNNASFAAYAETARLDFLERLGESVTSLILANLSIDYRRQVAFRESIVVESWVERLGKSSIALVQVVLANRGTRRGHPVRCGSLRLYGGPPARAHPADARRAHAVSGCVTKSGAHRSLEFRP